MVFSCIVVPLDGSKLAEQSLVHAARIAKSCDSRLIVLQVLDMHQSGPDRGVESMDWRLRKLQAAEYLAGVAARLEKEGLKATTQVVEGRASEQIVDFIRSNQVDLVVMSAYGHGGVSGFAFGGTVHKIVAEPECSILIARPGGEHEGPAHPYRRILVLLDGSQRAAWAVSVVAAMVEEGLSEIVALEVVGSPEMPRTCPLTREETKLREKMIECNRRAAVRYLDEVRTQYPCEPSIRTRLEVSPNVVDTIVHAADEEDVDLIVLTAHGASGAAVRCSGTVCRAIAVLASRSVLILQDSPVRRTVNGSDSAEQWTTRAIHSE